jgi:lysophospholipase L1-like esterase
VDVGLEAFTTLEPFRTHLEYLVEIVQADGVKVLLCTQANVYNRPTVGTPQDSVFGMRNEFFRPTEDTCVSADSMRRVMAAARDIIRDIADRRDTLFLDVESVIGGEATCFLDDYHLTQKGNAQIARAMAEYLAPVLDTLPDHEGEQAP